MQFAMMARSYSVREADDEDYTDEDTDSGAQPIFIEYPEPELEVGARVRFLDKLSGVALEGVVSDVEDNTFWPYTVIVVHTDSTLSVVDNTLVENYEEYELPHFISDNEVMEVL